MASLVVSEFERRVTELEQVKTEQQEKILQLESTLHEWEGMRGDVEKLLDENEVLQQQNEKLRIVNEALNKQLAETTKEMVDLIIGMGEEIAVREDAENKLNKELVSSKLLTRQTSLFQLRRLVAYCDSIVTYCKSTTMVMFGESCQLLFLLYLLIRREPEQLCRRASSLLLIQVGDLSTHCNERVQY